MRELFQSPPKAKIDPVIPQDKPVYRILSEKGFFGPDDTLHPEGSIIVLFDTPNEDMEPMNELAREALSTYLDYLDECDQELAKANGRKFAPRTRGSKEEIMANAHADARRIQSLSNPNGVSIMNAKMDSSKRIQTLGEEPAQDVGSKVANKRAKIETISAA